MQPSFEITKHPIDLSEHGRTPTGAPLFRIVRADTRVDKVRFEGRTHEIARYEAAESKWVLEKWLSAFDLTQMTPEQYESLLESQLFGSAQMPYPEGGDYELSYVFDGSVDVGKAHKIAAMIQFGHENRTDEERAQSLKEAATKKALDVESMKAEIVKTALTRGTHAS